MNTNGHSSLSLVITSYTTERLNDIYELLESIKKQTYQNMETIFVVERSQELCDMLDTFIKEKQIDSVRIVFSPQKLGLSMSRNLGIENAEGDIIAFVDDDVVLFPDWAEEMAHTYHDETIIGVTGPGYPVWEDSKMSWLPDEFQWIVSCTAFTGWQSARTVRSTWGMNMSFRKEVFKESRFSPNFGNTNGGKEAWKSGPVDDAEFSIRVRMKTGKHILYNPKVQVYHNVYKYRLTLKFIRGQCYWQGYSKALLKKMYPEDNDTSNLTRERSVLERILFRMLPLSLAGLFYKPLISFKRIKLSIYALFFVALGYISCSCPKMFGFAKKYFIG
ncbi:MAG: glycosyltransferase family 2 protein [Dehalococcoidales bacterium]|nr:glycosyltransferase family 2 protein [Dehalococcoidales bacterium]